MSIKIKLLKPKPINIKLFIQYRIKFCFFMLFCAIFCNSCQKNDLSQVLHPQQVDQRVSSIIKSMQERYGKMSAPVVYPVNKVVDGFYVNKKGEEISLIRPSTISRNTLSCNFDCTTAEGPWDLDITYTLDYVTRFYYCGSSESEIVANWTISVPYTVLLQNPINSLQFSRGRMRFKDPIGSGVSFTNNNIQAISITSLGADPTCSSNTLYQITYNWSDVPNFYFNSGNILECGLFLYNDCDITNYNYLTSWEQGIGFIGDGTYAGPCDRVDKITYAPSEADIPELCALVLGAYIVCGEPPFFPSGFVTTELHQLEYRKRNNVNSFAWVDQSSAIENGIPYGEFNESPTFSPYVGLLKLKKIYQGESTTGWLIRYRNINTLAGCGVITTKGAYWAEGTYNTEFWLY